MCPRPHNFRFSFSNLLEAGKCIDEVIPLFHGYFPITQPKIIIEDLSYLDFSGNVLITNNHQEVTIQFYESDNSSKAWSQIIQEFNQDKLIKNLVMKNTNTKLPTSILYNLGFMGFEESGSVFTLVGDIPNWFRTLFPNYNYSSSIFELTTLFPFLEVFFPEATQLFNKNTEGKLLSGLWAEYDNENQETLLQATAIKENGKNILLIESISDRFPNQHKNIQHAREVVLKHQQLIKTEKKLRQLFENQEQFISIFSHDIRGPLSGAFTLLNILKKDESFMKNFNKEQTEVFTIMNKGLKDLYDYTLRLHEWSNAHFGNFELDLSGVNLLELVENLKGLHLELLSTKSLELEISIPASLTIKIDEPLFKNALHNLLANAIKFSNTNNSIKITAIQDTDSTTIQVIDTGIGIPESFKRSLFEYQEKRSSKGTHGEKGSGIGLTVVKRIVDLHNASITIDSEINVGTTVTIVLPN